MSQEWLGDDISAEQTEALQQQLMIRQPKWVKMVEIHSTEAECFLFVT